MSNPATQYRICYYIYALTTVKGASVKQALHSLLDGKIMNIVSAVSWTDIPTEVMATSTICNQDSVRICSLDVKMNNTDEKLLLYCRCLETFNL